MRWPQYVVVGAVLVAAVIGSLVLSRAFFTTHSGWSATRPVRLSGPAPAPGCPPTSTSRYNAEPSLGANPIGSDSRHSILVGAWSQELESNTGDVFAASSQDSGKTWRVAALPFSTCAPGGLDFAAAGDPWVSIGPDGTVYATAVALDSAFSAEGVLAASSMDGGHTWHHAQKIIYDPTIRTWNDKDSLAADPTRPGVAYVAWVHRLTSWRSIPTVAGAVWWAQTADGGKQWGKPRPIVRGSLASSADGPVVLVDPRTDRLYVVYWTYHNTRYGRTVSKTLCATTSHRTCRTVRRTQGGTKTRMDVEFIASTDEGATWSAPHHIATVITAKDKLPDYPYWDKFITGQFYPAAALDPKTGAIYVVWNVQHQKTGDIMLAQTHDGGTHWSQPLRVNRPSDGPAFTASVAVNAQGMVGVTYFTHIRSAEVRTIPTDYWFRGSRDGLNFDAPIKLGGPFDHAVTFGSSSIDFLGEYMGLVADDQSFHSLFVMTHPASTDVGDVFTTTVSP